MGKPGGSHPGRVGGEKASRDAGRRQADRRNNGGGKVTGSTVGGMGVDSAGYGLNRADLKTDNLGNPDVKKNAKDLKEKLDKQKVNQTNLSVDERGIFAKNLHNMQGAYSDSLDDGLGGFFSALSPFGEINPYSDVDFAFGAIDPNTGQPQVDANWGLDYGSVIASALGALAGVPVGTLYGIGKMSGVIPSDFATMNMGSSIIGKPASVTSTPDTAANPSATTASKNFSTTPAPAQKSLSPLNNRIGGYSAGGYNMGAFGKKPAKKSSYLTQQLMAP